MNPGFRTFDAQGRETFNIFMPVIRQEQLQYLPANSSGAIDLSAYLGGSSAVRFMPSNYQTFWDVIAPYAYMDGKLLRWTTAAHAHYAIITGVVR